MTPKQIAGSLLPAPKTAARDLRDDELAILIPAALVRLVLHRVVARGLRARYQRIEVHPFGDQKLDKQPLGEQTGGTSMLLLRLRATPDQADGFLSRPFVHSLGDLPGVVVARPAGSYSLLIDLRLRSPSRPPAGTVPSGEIWLFAESEATRHATLSMRLIPEDDPHTLEEFIGVPAHLQREPDSFPVAATNRTPLRLPKAEPVHTIRRATPHPCEAIALDEQDLDRLRRLLRTRPLGEQVFLLPGPKRVLLTGPPETLRGIPFGIPLWRCGPGGLFLELGLDLFPPLPTPARKRIFNLNAQNVVVLTARQAYSFQLKNLRPAWVLWAGDGPRIEDGLSETTADLLSRFQQVPVHATQKDSAPASNLGLPEDPRPEFLRQAQHAQLLGDLRGAAELLEKANELRAAARLWEQAAREMS